VSERRHGRLASNFRWLVLSYGATKVAALVTVFLLARSLGDELFGRFAIALAIPLSLEAIADLGLGWALVREGAGRPELARRLAYVALGPKLALAGISVGITYAIAAGAGMPAQIVEATLFLAIAKAADSLTYLCRAVFQAHERMDYDAAALTFDSALRLVLVVYAVAGDFGLVGFAKAYAVSALIVLSATGLFCFHRLLRPPVWDPALLRYLFATGVPLAAVWLMDGIGGRIGILAVGGLLGDAAAGNFAAALRLVEPLLAIPALMSTALLPLATRHLVEERETMAWLFEATLKIAILIGTAGMVTFIGVGGTLVAIVFGAEFIEARTLIGQIALALVPLFVHGLLLSVLVALRRQTVLLASQIAGILVNLAILLTLAGAFGTRAAPIALLAAEIFTIAVAFALVPELRALRLGHLVRSFAAAVPAIAALATTPVIGGPAATIGALGLLVIALRLGRVIEPREIAYIESASPFLGRIGRAIFAG
jgi:O-antigen/teichoic acid export membrane protein